MLFVPVPWVATHALASARRCWEQEAGNKQGDKTILFDGSPRFWWIKETMSPKPNVQFKIRSL